MTTMTRGDHQSAKDKSRHLSGDGPGRRAQDRELTRPARERSRSNHLSTGRRYDCPFISAQIEGLVVGISSQQDLAESRGKTFLGCRILTIARCRHHKSRIELAYNLPLHQSAAQDKTRSAPKVLNGLCPQVGGSNVCSSRLTFFPTDRPDF